MIKNYLIKMIALSIITVSIIALNPIGASAAWKQSNTDWWYTEGSLWATGWRSIDGKWYYFYQNGYMAKNTTISGYKIYSNGVAEDSPTKQENPSSYTWKIKGEAAADVSKDGPKDISKDVLKNGSKDVSNNYYYIENDKVIGEMVYKNNNLYYMENGQYFNGWKKLGGSKGYKWYYMEEGKRYVGWKNIDGKWYYLSDITSDSDIDVYNLKGKMINTSVMDAGKSYEFDDFGVLQSTIEN